MDQDNPLVRYLHFILLGRRVGLDGHWPTSFLYDHDTSPKDEFARTVFNELTGLGYMTSTPAKVHGIHSGMRYEVTPAGKEYFLSLDAQKSTGG